MYQSLSSPGCWSNIYGCEPWGSGWFCIWQTPLLFQRCYSQLPEFLQVNVIKRILTSVRDHWRTLQARAGVANPLGDSNPVLWGLTNLTWLHDWDQTERLCVSRVVKVFPIYDIICRFEASQSRDFENCTVGKTKISNILPLGKTNRLNPFWATAFSDFDWSPLGKLSGINLAWRRGAWFSGEVSVLGKVYERA